MREQLISYITTLLGTVTDYSKRQILQGFLNYLQSNLSITTEELETIRNVVNNIATEAETAPQPQGFVFKQIDDVVYSTRNVAVPGFWDKSGVIARNDFVTYSSQPDHYNDYYVNIFKGSLTTDPEFSVAFASKENYGGGTNEITRKHYLAFINQFKTNLASDVITVPRDPANPGAGFSELKNFMVVSFHNFADTIDVGNFQINLSFTDGSNRATLSLVDNSGETNLATPIRTQVQPFYYLVSGSLQSGRAVPVTHSITQKVFGIVFPQSALLLIDLDACGDFVSHSLGVGSGGYSTSLYMLNPTGFPIDSNPPGGSVVKLHENTANLILDMTLSMVDNIHSMVIFCRVKAGEFNYSLNPTFYDPTSGRILYPDQGTYITTVGIYDQNNQLVALGRLSSPLRKTNEDEYVIKLKVEF